MTTRRVVMKFGGTSVSSLERWRTIADLIAHRQAEGLHPIIVCSAISGVSNLLERLLPDSVVGQGPVICETLRDAHEKLADELDISPGVVEDDLAELERIASGAELLGEFTPRLRARVMAMGELMLSKLAFAWLRNQGIPVTWVDARTLLTSLPGPNPSRHYLSASCPFTPDPSLDLPAGLVITQGFIARDAQGDTVLLGRGGSDTSAAYLAARFNAERLEIWTDVPGMYTADPRVVPHARLLRRMDYNEAQELAAMGAKVLHPRCLAPVAQFAIPLWIKATPRPEAEGTIIEPQAKVAPGVKALAARKGILVLSIETLGMWQEAGFLARAFGVLQQHGLSVDHVATGESNVTVTLDALANALDPAVLDQAVQALRSFAEVKVVGPCAAVSLVGRNIRSILHELGPALEAFAEFPIHLVSQAASDLDLTFVVDEVHADRLLLTLHQRLLDQANSPELGPAWREDAPAPSRWMQHREKLLAAANGGTPLYVHDLSEVQNRAQSFAQLPLHQAFFAMKACPLPEVLSAVASEGLGIECVSIGELRLARQAAPAAKLLFTPNFAPRAEYEAAYSMGATVTIDGLHPVQQWGELLQGKSALVRVDPGHGRGHHRHVRTAGAASKFGIPIDELPSFARACADAGVTIAGVHAHVGSGVYDLDSWLNTGKQLLDLRKLFPAMRVIDLGGGLAVPYRPRDPHFDLAGLADRLTLLRQQAPEIEFWMEPGRWLVAEAGALLVRVTQLKERGGRRIIGVDAGMNALLRPALYGAWHSVENLSRPDGPRIVADVVGPICESADLLAQGRSIVAPEEGDILLVGTAGAYGLAMASTYNSRPLPRSVLWA